MKIPTSSHFLRTTAIAVGSDFICACYHHSRLSSLTSHSSNITPHLCSAYDKDNCHGGIRSCLRTFSNLSFPANGPRNRGTWPFRMLSTDIIIADPYIFQKKLLKMDTPGKINIEPKNRGLEDHYPF